MSEYRDWHEAFAAGDCDAAARLLVESHRRFLIETLGRERAERILAQQAKQFDTQERRLLFGHPIIETESRE